MEHFPPLEWFFFCEMQNHFEEAWALIDGNVDKAKIIEEFEVFAKDQLKFLQTWRTTRWPGGNPLSLIANDMIKRLVLRCENPVEFPYARPRTEIEGKEGDDAWLLEKEIFPSFGDAFHQRFSLRLFYLGAVFAALNISPSFWKNTAMIEVRFVYPMLPSGIREDFLAPFEKFIEELRGAGVLKCFGEWLIRTQKVSFLCLERIFGTDKYELFENNLLRKALPLILPLSSSWLPKPVSILEEEFDASPFVVGVREIFIISLPDERFASQNKLLEEGEWEQTKHWPEQEWSLGQTEIGASQLRLLSSIMMKWWRALWSEGFLPPPSYRSVSFHQAIQQTDLSGIKGVIVQP